MSWQKTDAEILDFLDERGGDLQVSCWNVLDDPEAADNGWTVTYHNEDVGQGRTLRMAVSDAMHHPERFTAVDKERTVDA